MIARKLALLMLLVIPSVGYCQVSALDLYQYNYTTISPAFAGVDGMKITGIGNLVSFKGGGNNHSAFAGFEGKVKNVGGGFSYSGYHVGTITVYNFNLPVNYQFKLGETRKLIMGARLSYQGVTTDFSLYIPLDPNDPLLSVPNKFKQTFLNWSLGGLYKGQKFYAGLSFDNVDSSIPGSSDRNHRATQYHLVVGKSFGGNGSVESNHSIYATLLDSEWRVDLNNNIIIKKKIIAGVSLQFNEEDILPKVNAGYKFGDVAQVVISLYSKANESRYKNFSGQLFLQFNIRNNNAE